MKTKEQDFTRGSVIKQLAAFTLPLFAANILQYCYQAADMIIVGQVMGNTGLVAIGTASMISFCINAFAIGVTAGGTVAIAKRRGAGDEAGQRTASAAVFALAAACSLVVAAGGLAFAPLLFAALNVPASSFGDAVSYTAIVCSGSVFTFGYNAACSLLRGVGDSRGPLAFVAAATVANIVLDLAFVMGLGWGVAGAACATVIAQALSCVLAARYLIRRYPSARPRFEGVRVLFSELAAVLEVGIPSALQMVVVNVSYLLVTGMLNAYGTEVAAASGIGLKISTLSGLPCWAIGQAVTAMTSQNAGARKPGRMREAVLASCGVSVAVIAVIAIATQVFACDLARLFGASDAATVEIAVLYLRITCSFNAVFYALMYCFDSFALGSGAPRLALVNSLFDAVVIRFGLAWLLGWALGFGFAGIYVAQALSPVIPTLIGVTYFLRGTWAKEAR